jgi:hypothetical protein
MSKTASQKLAAYCGDYLLQVVLEHVSEAPASEHHQKPSVSETQNSTHPPILDVRNSYVSKELSFAV